MYDPELTVNVTATSTYHKDVKFVWNGTIYEVGDGFDDKHVKIHVKSNDELVKLMETMEDQTTHHLVVTMDLPTSVDIEIYNDYRE